MSMLPLHDAQCRWTLCLSAFNFIFDTLIPGGHSHMKVMGMCGHDPQNVWSLPNYAFPGTIVVKSVNFEPNLNGTENFWIFAKFHPQVPSGQKSDFWTKFLTWLKISGFCQISSFAGPAWSKISFLSQIFQHLSKFLDFAKFHPSQVQSGQNSQFWANFKRD